MLTNRDLISGDKLRELENPPLSFTLLQMFKAGDKLIKFDNPSLILTLFQMFKDMNPNNPFFPLHEHDRVIWKAKGPCNKNDVVQILYF